MNIFQACQLFSEFTLGLFNLIEMDFKAEEGGKDEEKKIEGRASHKSESNLNASYSKEDVSPYGQRDPPNRSSSGAQEDATNLQESTSQSRDCRNGNRESGMLSKESLHHNDNSRSGSQVSAIVKGSNVSIATMIMERIQRWRCLTKVTNLLKTKVPLSVIQENKK